MISVAVSLVTVYINSSIDKGIVTGLDVGFDSTIVNSEIPPCSSIEDSILLVIILNVDVMGPPPDIWLTSSLISSETSVVIMWYGKYILNLFNSPSNIE